MSKFILLLPLHRHAQTLKNEKKLQRFANKSQLYQKENLNIREYGNNVFVTRSKAAYNVCDSKS